MSPGTASSNSVRRLQSVMFEMHTNVSQYVYVAFNIYSSFLIISQEKVTKI